jgi:hypothetical protein
MKKWLKSPLGISIGTALFSFILSIGYDFLKSKPVFSTLWTILKAIWNVIFTFLNFELKVWWIIIGIAVLFILLLIVFRISSIKEETKSDYLNYREDNFQHWRWSWKWEWNTYKRAWVVADLKGHCPKCNTPMVEQQSILDGVQFTCPRCNFHASGSRECDESYNVERVIHDNIDRNHQ